MAELYSLIETTEHLESAFIRGVIENADYERCCAQILAQYKTMQQAFRNKGIVDIKTWARDQGLVCPLAEERLFAGVAATTMFGSRDANQNSESLAVFQASEGFISLIDETRYKLGCIGNKFPEVRQFL